MARTPEFLEEAFQRAKKRLNPRDFAVIFQAARASAGGKASAKNRRNRAAAKLVNGFPVVGMSKAELCDLQETTQGAESLAGSHAVGKSLANAIIKELQRRTDDTFDPESVKGPIDLEEPTIDVEVDYANAEELEFDEHVEKNTLGAKTGDILEVTAEGKILGLSKSVVPDSPEDAAEIKERWKYAKKHCTRVPFVGPADAKLMFVCAAPNPLEVARGEGLVGDDALQFEKAYLEPLGLTKKSVAVGFVMPVLPVGDLDVGCCEPWQEHFIEAMKTYSGAKVVAVGRVAREVMEKAGVKCWSLPHPSVVRRRGDSGEVSRKLKAIAKSLDAKTADVQNQPSTQKSAPRDGDATGKLADAISEMRKTGSTTCRVVKSAEEKQIVYGVVLDPYRIDLQDDWVPPAEIESTAHGFLKKSRVIGFEHMERADAQIVESWVEPYPSTVDYKAALENKPHRAYTRKFGDDDIHSGTWMAGVQLGDEEWALHKQGKLDAFSVGGFSFKTAMAVEEMPEVEFIELIQEPVKQA